jgi:hypothetical protein
MNYPINLIECDCHFLADLVSRIQSIYDDDPCFLSFLEVASNPESSEEDINAALISRNQCIADLRNERADGGVLTDPAAEETNDAFDKYVSDYGDASLHNYEGAPSVQGPMSQSKFGKTLSASSARDSQYAEWSAGCGSAPEPLWLRGDICPCDCKQMYYVDNGVLKEDKASFIFPDGKSITSATNVFTKKNVKIVINGKLVETKYLVTAGQEYNIEANIPNEQAIAGNLISKTFFTSMKKKQQFVIANM